MSDDDLARPAVRPIEEGVRTDFREAMSYGGYLELDTLLAAQNPRSAPVHHDELLFIVQHQTSELWLKLVIHELEGTRSHLAADELGPALKCLARVKAIQRQLVGQWAVLATLTPREYAQFRDALGSSSGFQSFQYRAVEFMLGNKHPGMMRVFEADPAAHALLERQLAEPTVYDAFWRHVSRLGLDVPAEVLDRDVTQAWTYTESLVPLVRRIYEDESGPWGLYEACEDLVDLEDNFQEWRFRHLRTVQRTIGFKRGTGGSSGVDFLRRALDLTFFPELYAVRTVVGT